MTLLHIELYPYSGSNTEPGGMCFVTSCLSDVFKLDYIYSHVHILYSFNLLAQQADIQHLVNMNRNTILGQDTTLMRLLCVCVYTCE